MFFDTPICHTIFCLYLLVLYIGDCPFIASAKCMQRYVHCIVLCSLHTSSLYNFIYLGFKCRFQHCTGHIMTGSFVGRRNQYIQFVKVLYCKLLVISKQLLIFPYKVRDLNHQPQRWEASVLPQCQRGPFYFY